MALRNSDGSKPLQHAGKKVYTAKKSIQGGWKENMWDQYPQHEMERFEWFYPPEFLKKEVKRVLPSEGEERKRDIVSTMMRRKRYFI